MVQGNASAVKSVFSNEFAGYDFGVIGKNILFVTYWINDLIVRLITAILKLTNLPFTNYHATIILVIVYMILLYIVISTLENAKPLVKWGILGAIIWLLIGFFKV